MAATGAGPMTHWRRAAIAVGLGSLLAVGVFAIAALAPTAPTSTVVLSSGLSYQVPAEINYTTLNGGPGPCGEHHDCVRAGELVVNFTLFGNARLTGTFGVSGPVEVVVAQPASYASGGCGGNLWWPPANCTTARGSQIWQESVGPGSLDLGAVEFGFAGGGDVVSSGSWALGFFNWGDQPVNVSVTAPFEATPS